MKNEILNNKKIVAITGPSGSGKTTLGNKLKTNNGMGIARHCTTRNRRIDDEENFYRYLTHEEYSMMFNANKFLISSGDSLIIKKEYGNFYGVLVSDCIESWKDNSTIILFVSYKDIDFLLNLKQKGLNIKIVNLTFKNIEENMIARLNTNKRNHSQEDIEKRIKCAIEYEKTYGELVRRNSDSVIYTDILNIEQTYEKVCYDLNLPIKLSYKSENDSYSER